MGVTTLWNLGCVIEPTGHQGMAPRKGPTMSSMFKWEVVDPAPGEAVAPNQRLAWGKTIGLGAQHVVAMFGATFVFPLIMGLNANLAVMMSGVATICFLLIVQGKVPSYLGTSASFVASVAAIRSQGGDSADVSPGGPVDGSDATLSDRTGSSPQDGT